MSLSRKQLILAATEKVDVIWRNRSFSDLLDLKLTFPVPSLHPRSQHFTHYSLSSEFLKSADFPANHLVIIDEHLLAFDWLQELIESRQNIIPLQADESRVKDVDFLNNCLRSMQVMPGLIGIGGGTLLNIVGYLAEKLQSNVTFIPTTPMAMCDTSIGGKVRVNQMINGEFEKHHYRSFYEPNKIIVDPRFLDSLHKHDCSNGIAEIVKHALYQSKGLLEYLLSAEFSPTENKMSLLKAILWTADLKRICLEVDPEESEDGSYFILRAAHDAADEFEKASNFKITHGEAVWKGMDQDLQNNAENYQLLTQLKMKLWS